MGNFEYDWKLLADGIPELTYVDNPLDLNRTDKLGVLLRQKQAADLEALRLTEFSTKVKILPRSQSGSE